MPCFSNAPNPDDPHYKEWLTQVEALWDAFVHVVDYYFDKAGESVPYPEECDRETMRSWCNPLERYIKPAKPANWSRNAEIIRQILLHLDCDGITEIQLNDIGNFGDHKFRRGALTPNEIGYLWVQSQCFSAYRNNEV